MTAIDVGPGAANRSTVGGFGDTWIDLTNPANASGKITSVKLWMQTNATGVKVGTFFGSGTNYDNRDYEIIGNVAANSEQTFSGLNCDVVINDFAGAYFVTGAIEAETPGYSGVYHIAGDKFGTGVNTYVLIANACTSIYLIGDTWGGNIAKINNIGSLSIAKIDGITVTNITKVNGITV